MLGPVFVERLSLRQGDAQRPIPAQTPGSGQNKVTHAGQTRKGQRAGSQGHAQSSDLGQTTGDQCGPWVMSHAQTLQDSGRDRNDVFQCSRQLDPDDVVMGVHPKGRSSENALRCQGRGLRAGGSHHQSWLSLTNLAGKAGS